MTTWTDNPATSSTHIRVVHVNELRGAVNTDRAAVGLAAYPWTDDPVSTSTHIRAVHFLELRTAIQELWFIKRLGPLPNWSVGRPPMATRQVSARDINDLRSWVDTYDRSPAPGDPQGIVSFLYNPRVNNNTGAGVSDQFGINAAQLTPASSPLLQIRTKIYTDSANRVPISALQTALGVWARNGFTDVAIVLDADFTSAAVSGCANGSLGYGGNPLLNSYIAAFSSQARQVAQALAPSGATTYWVWNEPNIGGIINPGQNCPQTSSALAPEVFGAMLYPTASALKNGGATTVYAGSLSMLPGTDPTGPFGAQYLDKMYVYLNAHGVVAPYPWDAWSLNIEGYPDDNFLKVVKIVLSQKQVQYSDAAPFIIGEWGAAVNAYNFSSAQAAYQALRANFSTLYFYIHPFDSSSGFGATDWDVENGLFTATGPLVWYGGLQALYQSP